MLDYDYLIEEIESLGNSDQRALFSYLARILQHLLKCEYQPEKHTRSWDISIRTYRSQVKRILKNNPSYKRLLNESLKDSYDSGRVEAQKETGLDIDIFPEECPWTIEEILDEVKK